MAPYPGVHAEALSDELRNATGVEQIHPRCAASVVLAILLGCGNLKAFKLRGLAADSAAPPRQRPVGYSPTSLTSSASRRSAGFLALRSLFEPVVQGRLGLTACPMLEPLVGPGASETPAGRTVRVGWEAQVDPVAPARGGRPGPTDRDRRIRAPSVVPGRHARGGARRGGQPASGRRMKLGQ